MEPIEQETQEDTADPEDMVKEIKDPWLHRSSSTKCEKCMWYKNYRCRRHAPTMQGYPAVYPYDWCGDHKLDKLHMGRR